MVKEDKIYRVTLVHPLAKHNIEISFYNEREYVEWKPYLDKIEAWLVNQYMINVTNGKFIED